MKLLTITVIISLLAFVATSENLQAQAKKKKTSHKSQTAEWKDARNGATLSVKWTLKVGLVWSDRAHTHLYSKDDQHSSCWVNLYNGGNIDQDDIIVVT